MTTREMLASAQPPSAPFRGVLSFRLIDRPIFTGRQQECEKLYQLVRVFRGVLLHGDSGAGKSSLVNAGLIPAVIEAGFEVERLRVQPLEGAELVIERIPLTEAADSEALPSVFTRDRSQAGVRRTASLDDLMAALTEYHSSANAPWRLVIFDQFEELVTQFEDAQTDKSAYDAAKKVQHQIVQTICRLLVDRQWSIKLLLVFREDYFGRLAELFPAFPQLKDQSLRLTSPSVDSLKDITQKPFEAVRFSHQLSAAAQAHVIAGFTALSKNGFVNLTEVQIACASLWDNPGLEEEFLSKPDPRTAVEWIFEGYVPRTLEKLPARLQDAAIAALCRLITPATATSSGTRNIVSEVNLTTVLQQEDGHDLPVIQDALAALCEDARLVFLQTRGNTPFYEIVSEFLVRGIAARRPGVEQAREQRRALQLQAEVDRQTAELTTKTTELEAKNKTLDEQNGRLRTRTYGVVAALMAAVALAGLAYHKSDQAERSRLVAVAEAAMAAQERDIAKREKDNADAERKLQVEQLLAQRDREQQQRQQLQATLKQTETRLLAAAVNKAEVTRAFTQAIQEIKDPLISRLAGATADVTIAEYSPDGRFIALGAADKKIRVWNRLGGTMLAQAVASASTGGVTTLAFSPDATILLAGSSGSTLRLFDPRQPDLDAGKEIKVHSDSITHVEFSPDGKFSVSCGGDGTVALLDWSNYPKIIPSKSLSNWRHEKAVTFATFSADGSRVVTSADDSETKVFATSGSYGLVPVTYGGSSLNPLDVDPGAALHTPVRKMRFSPKDRDLVVGGAGNRKVIWWDLKGKRIALFRDDKKSGLFFHEGAVLDVAFRPTGTHAATIATDGLCLIWDAYEAKTIVSVPTEIQGRLFGVAWQKDDLLALVGEDGWLELWDMQNPSAPEQVFATQAHAGVARGVRFDPLGRQVLTWSGYQDGYTNASLPYLPDAKGKAAALKFTGKDRPSDNTAAIWDIESARARGWTKHPAP
ncbi:MAG: hypothetical protein IAE77_13335 [Prosthecobacter sp.]|jgi:WD40 repeat protein|uniref:NACHT and WD repeat domain-containing protein n=1 Tax=Prosthecobacter sp. TaxID=1965333 RepID=UPI0019ECD5B6|nr:AAA family ATPase [Prosthecobacter sp.]MBE2284434.1 hypothetical protein [Prosthecobacter sp.]